MALEVLFSHVVYSLDLEQHGRRLAARRHVVVVVAATQARHLELFEIERELEKLLLCFLLFLGRKQK